MAWCNAMAFGVVVFSVVEKGCGVVFIYVWCSMVVCSDV